MTTIAEPNLSAETWKAAASQSSTDVSPPPTVPRRSSGWGRGLRWVLRTAWLTLAVAAVVAIGIMVLGWHMAPSDVGSIVVQADGLTVHEALRHGPLALLGMWLLITVGLVLGFLMALFGVSVALLCIVGVLVMLALLGLLLASPALLVGALLLWTLRKASGSNTAV